MPNVKPIDQQEISATAVENCLPKGTRLADFEIIGVIGEGGFGIVYFAFDRSLRRMVAIKEYMPGAFAGRGPDKKVVVRAQRHRETFAIGLKSFIKEARLLAQFDHPALIKVYRFWEQNNTAYMAMRYYEGRTLKSVVQNSPAQVTEAWLKSMLKPMLEALDAMYRVQILHRDISPDNIMIQKNGEAVLLDFGAARQIIGDMTHSLTVILKPGYAPIEQYADDAMMKQGPWTDIYSLSAVIYFAIVKTAPPTSVARMIKDPITPLQDGQHSGFSKEFLAAIDKGLAVKPEDRPQSIEEFRKLLDLELSVPMPMPDNDASSPAAFRPPSRKPGEAPVVTSGKRRRNRSPAPQASLLDKPLRAPGWWLVAAVTVLGLGAFLWLKPARLPTSAPAIAAARAPVAAAKVAPAVLPVPKLATAPAEQAHDKVAVPDGKGAVTEANAAVAAKAVDAKATEVKAVEPTGVVMLTIKPWGKVLVDGSMKGVSPPLKKLVLPEGKHQIKVINPSFPDRLFDIDVSPKKSRNIDYDFSSQ
ncbi:Serine/threonine protein kinase [Collimonas sp. OK307]|nr:Serine/threonine protein kinase [Collimonas sp. OK307]